MKVNLNSLKEEKLLSLSLRDCPVRIQDSPFLSSLIERVLLELNKKGFTRFKPFFYLGDEWFSPEGLNAVSIPFYLAHPRLIEMEKKMTGEAEGETKAWFMRTVRHEIGHCIDHAYQFSKQKEWKEIFGDPKQTYDPDNYSFDPKSKDYVINLEDHYAQAHPDEDFAETFAVWLQYDRKSWEYRYKNWPNALKKLHYVDKILTKTIDKNSSVDKRTLIAKASKLSISLKSYYKEKKERLAH